MPCVKRLITFDEVTFTAANALISAAFGPTGSRNTDASLLPSSKSRPEILFCQLSDLRKQYSLIEFYQTDVFIIPLSVKLFDLLFLKKHYFRILSPIFGPDAIYRFLSSEHLLLSPSTFLSLLESPDPDFLALDIWPYDRSCSTLIQTWRGMIAQTGITDAFEFGVRHALNSSSDATQYLLSGWSWPESSHVWSDGLTSVIQIPNRCLPVQDRLSCIITGFCISGEIIIEASIDSVVVFKVAKSDHEDRNLRIVFAIPNHQYKEHLKLVLHYSKTERGLESDQRQLAFAAQSLMIFEDRLETALDPDIKVISLLNSARESLVPLDLSQQLAATSGVQHKMLNLSQQFKDMFFDHLTRAIILGSVPHEFGLKSLRFQFDGELLPNLKEYEISLEHTIDMCMEDGTKVDMILCSEFDLNRFLALFDNRRAHPALSDTVWGISVSNFDALALVRENNRLRDCIVHYIWGYILFQPSKTWDPFYGSTYAMLVSKYMHGSWHYYFQGHSAFNARTIPTIKMLEQILSDITICPQHGDYFLTQYDDYCHMPVSSVAYGRKNDERSIVQLIPDTYYFFSCGYAALRALSEEDQLTPWRERKEKFFWRGTPTYGRKKSDGTDLASVADVPRIVFCEQADRIECCDVGLLGTWGDVFDQEVMRLYIDDRQLFKQRISMIEHAQYRFLFDLDGVSNAWGFVERLLTGSCILKIESSYEQWFYNQMRAWVHFVPVKADLSDLQEKIDWCLNHDEKAQEIAQEGRKLGLKLTLEATRRQTVEAIVKCMFTDRETKIPSRYDV